MTRRYGGTGLGLAISRAFCKLMGYRLEVSSEVSKGTTFSLYFTTASADRKEAEMAVS